MICEKNNKIFEIVRLIFFSVNRTGLKVFGNFARGRIIFAAIHIVIVPN